MKAVVAAAAVVVVAVAVAVAVLLSATDFVVGAFLAVVVVAFEMVVVVDSEWMERGQFDGRKED